MISGAEHESLVRSALVDHADAVDSLEPSGSSFDFRARFGRRHVLVSVKSIAAARVEALIGRLAEGTLVGRAEAKGAVPMVVVVAPRLGPKSLEAAEEFMVSYAPDVGWGALDERGVVRLRVAAVGLDVHEEGERESAAPVRHSVKQPFSDLNRWLAKVLMKVPRNPVGGGGVRTAADLAEVAGVSRSKAYRFVRDFESLGYLDGRRLVLRDLPSLLEDWVHEDRLVPAARVYVRGLFGPLESSGLGGEGRVLGGFAACEHHGLLHAPYQVPEVHVRAVDAALDALGAGRCDARDAEAALIVSAYPESVFRAASGGVVDPWQAALDVVASPARGLEQAELVRERILAESGA